MAKRNPYSFPLRARSAIVEFLIAQSERTSRYYQGERFPFCWNVKAYADTPKEFEGYKFNPALDSAWEERADSAYYQAIEFAQDHSREDWTSYPGSDQGDWKFSFQGRSGGWLCLESWRGQSVTRMDSHDLREWLDSLSYRELLAFYRGIMTANSDFTSQKAEQEISYRLGDIRHTWETEGGGARILERIELEARMTTGTDSD